MDMKLPNAEKAIIPSDKLTSYLLNLDHRRGGSKAKLLVLLGYKASSWDVLAEDIRREHLSSDVVEEHDSEWGKRYEIVAPLTGPLEDTVLFRSIWQMILAQIAQD